jgi:hypothetical protein
MCRLRLAKARAGPVRPWRASCGFPAYCEGSNISGPYSHQGEPGCSIHRSSMSDSVWWDIAPRRGVRAPPIILARDASICSSMYPHSHNSVAEEIYETVGRDIMGCATSCVRNLCWCREGDITRLGYSCLICAWTTAGLPFKVHTLISCWSTLILFVHRPIRTRRFHTARAYGTLKSIVRDHYPLSIRFYHNVCKGSKVTAQGSVASKINVTRHQNVL